MRKIFLLLAIVSTVLFVYSAMHLYQHFSNTSLPFDFEFKGFEDTNPTDDYSKLVGKFHQKIQYYEEQADHDQTWYFWMSFLVTALTAGATLVSSIQAAKKDVPNSNGTKTFAILIAILAFCSTLVNFSSTHFNDLKTEETKKATDFTNLRNQFFIDYDKATADTKLSVIRTYEQKMD